ncbi:hypothetical protein FSP39_009387, partial [Pinctada imbricata]
IAEDSLAEDSMAEDSIIDKKPFFSRCCPGNSRAMSFDLQKGQVDSRYRLPGVGNPIFKKNTQHSGKNCSYLVDFKVTFDPLPYCIRDWNPQCTDRPMCGKRLLRLDLEIDDNHGGFMFNVGDSATNNGYGGDYNTQKNDAEIMGKDNHIITYYSDYCVGEKEELLNSLAGARYVTLWIGNEFTRIQTRNSVGTVLQNVKNCNKCLFALNNQDDGNINMDIYVALNNMVLGTSRQGYGVCKARLQWECCEDRYLQPPFLPLEL